MDTADMIREYQAEEARLIRERDEWKARAVRAEAAEAELSAIRDPNCKIRKREWFDEEMGDALRIIHEQRAEVEALTSQLSASNARLEGVRVDVDELHRFAFELYKSRRGGDNSTRIAELYDGLSSLICRLDLFRDTSQPARPDGEKAYHTGWDGCDTDEEKP